jgi:hypothetical protein
LQARHWPFCSHGHGNQRAKATLEVVRLPNDIGEVEQAVYEVEQAVYKELRQLREAERFLCTAFEDLPAERIPADSIIRILYHLAEADERMDRLELLLDIDIMENCPLSTGRVSSVIQTISAHRLCNSFAALLY